MKSLKNTKILIATVVIIGSATLLSGCTSDDNPTTATESIKAPNTTVPERSAEINGLVRSIEGNEIVVSNEIKNLELTQEEREAQQADRKAMTQEERRALKAEITENLETETVTLVIPIGVPIVKGSGLSDGSNALSELSEIKAETYVSMWLDENHQVEAVKLKGVN